MIFSTLDNELEGINNKLSLLGKSFSSIKEDKDTKIGLKRSLFGKAIDDNDIACIKLYNEAIENGISSEEAWSRSMTQTSSAAKNLVRAANGGTVATEAMTKATNASKTAMIGAKVAATALNMALSAVIMIGIQFLIARISKAIHKSEELAQTVNDITTEYDDAQKTIQLHSKTINEISNRYQQLFTGVDAFGKNVSLTTDEFKEYNSICNEIAEMYPSLIQGWTEEGNAILTLKGNVEQLTEAYRNEQIEANNALINSGNDIFKNYKNQEKNLNNAGFWDEFKKSYQKGLDYKEYKKLLGAFNSDDLDKYIEDNFGNGLESTVDIVTLLEKKGYLETSKLSEFFTDDFKSGQEALKEALRTNKTEILALLSGYESELSSSLTNIHLLADAYFSNQILDKDSIASNLSEPLQNILHSVMNSIDFDTAVNFENENDLYDWINQYISIFSQFDNNQSKVIETLLNVQTEYNGDNCTAGEYNDAIKSANDAMQK